MMFSPKTYVLAAVFAAYSLGLWHVSSTYTESDYIKQENTQLKQAQEMAGRFYTELVTAQEQLKKKQSVITKEVIREIEKPVYRECRTTDDGVRLIEQSITNANEALSTD